MELIVILFDLVMFVIQVVLGIVFFFFGHWMASAFSNMSLFAFFCPRLAVKQSAKIAADDSFEILWCPLAYVSSALVIVFFMGMGHLWRAQPGTLIMLAYLAIPIIGWKRFRRHHDKAYPVADYSKKDAKKNKD